MKIELDLKDRIILLQNIPERKPVPAIKIMEKISVSEEEKETFGYEVSENKIKWNPEKDTRKEFDLSIEEISFINTMLDEMAKSGFLDVTIYQTYKKLKSL